MKHHIEVGSIFSNDVKNIRSAVIAGFAVAMIGSILWAVILLITGYKHSYVAMGIGALVGCAVCKYSKRSTLLLGIISAVFSIFAILLGDLLWMVLAWGNQEFLSIFETLKIIDFSAVPERMLRNSSLLDFIFYIAAIYTSFKLGTSHTKQQIENEEDSVITLNIRP